MNGHAVLRTSTINHVLLRLFSYSHKARLIKILLKRNLKLSSE